VRPYHQAAAIIGLGNASGSEKRDGRLPRLGEKQTIQLYGIDPRKTLQPAQVTFRNNSGQVDFGCGDS